MNFIQQLTVALDKLSKESEFRSSHVSLYLALFNYWNLNRFVNPISVCRSEVLNLSKVGSKTTYLKCLRDLHEKGFIVYEPSHDPGKGSLIYLTIFQSSKESSSDNVLVQVEGQVEGQEVGPSINSNNKVINKKNTSFYIPSLEEVKKYFLDIETTVDEAEKYYNYYTSKGWVVGNKSPMKDWTAAARNWKVNAGKFNVEKNGKSKDSNLPKGPGHLQVDQNKDYSIPL